MRPSRLEQRDSQNSTNTGAPVCSDSLAARFTACCFCSSVAPAPTLTFELPGVVEDRPPCAQVTLMAIGLTIPPVMTFTSKLRKLSCVSTFETPPGHLDIVSTVLGGMSPPMKLIAQAFSTTVLDGANPVSIVA